MTRGRLLTLALLGGAALFALEGGEYSTLDWLDLRRQEREEREAIERLTAEVDSLRRFADRLATDRRLQERVARENFGMIRQGEFLFRLEYDSLDAR